MDIIWNIVSVQVFVLPVTWCGGRDIFYHHFAPLFPLLQSLSPWLLFKHGIHWSWHLFIKLCACILQFFFGGAHISLEYLLNILCKR